MVALMGSQSALADSVTVTANYLGSARLGNTVGVGYKSGDIFPHPSDPFSSSVLIGGDSFNVDAPKAGLYGLPNGPFDAWCVDIWHWLHSPSTFTIDDTPTLASSLGVNGAARVSALTKLANLNYGSLNTQEESPTGQRTRRDITVSTIRIRVTTFMWTALRPVQTGATWPIIG